MPDRPHLIEEAVDLVTAQDPDREPDGFWHPSSISSLCARKSIYTIRGTKRSDVEPRVKKRNLRTGKILHEQFFQHDVPFHPDVREVYHEISLFDENEQIENAVPTVGNADSIVVFVDGGVEVQEYKTKSSNMMRSKKQLEALPEADHIVQARSYIRAIRKRGFETADGVQHPPIPDLSWARIAYLGKDTGVIAEFEITYDPERDDPELDARLRYLEAYRQDGEALPPRLPMQIKRPKGKKAYTDFHWLCTVCPWRYRCWDEDPDEIPLYEEYDGINPFYQVGNDDD